jgi:CRISPR type IV-associated protein Csf3
MTETIEDWNVLWYADGSPTCTFIKSDGTLLRGNQIEYSQIDKVLYQHEESNSWDWRCEALVQLKDGNYAYLTAWAETTFSDANHFIAEDLETLYKYSMSEGEEEEIKKALSESN